MFSDDTRKRLENIVSGTLIEEQGNTCTSIRNLLCTGFGTSTTVKKNFEDQLLVKKEQAKFLKLYATQNNLWLTDLPGDNLFLARGGEAKVYLNDDNRSVIS